MKKIIKLFFILICMIIPTSAIAQNLSVSDLEKICASEDNKETQNFIESKGYTYLVAESDSYLKEYVFSSDNGMKIDIVMPASSNGEKLITWTFSNPANLYTQLLSDFSKYYTKKDAENRKGYTSTTFSRPGIIVVVSSDKNKGANPIYQVAIRTINPATFLAN